MKSLTVPHPPGQGQPATSTTSPVRRGHLFARLPRMAASARVCGPLLPAAVALAGALAVPAFSFASSWSAFVVVCHYAPYYEGEGCSTATVAQDERGNPFTSIGQCYLWLDGKRDEFSSNSDRQTLGGCLEVRR